MKTKHTPGPWLNEDNHVTDANGDWICQLWGRMEEDFKPENESNCKLIAAAPELLQMVIDMLDNYEGLAGSAEEESSDHEIISRAKSLIKKATK